MLATRQCKDRIAMEYSLSNDKRSFREYFEEEHNVKLYDAMTFKELLILCNQYNVGGRFK